MILYGMPVKRRYPQKSCSKCRTIKSLDQFHSNRSNKDGLMNWCKLCVNKHDQEQRDLVVKPDRVTVSEKRCSKCKLVKSADEFNRSKKGKSGLQSWCRSCYDELGYDVDPAVCEKLCRVCGFVKPVDRFYRDKRLKGGLRNTCKDCSHEAAQGWRKSNPDKIKVLQRRNHLKLYYGMTQQAYDELLAKQGGMCVCGNPATCVDHDHETGEVRGLLCNPCNRTIGHALEDSSRLIKLAAYLDALRAESLEAV